VTHSEHNTEMGNNITSSKKQLVVIEEMKHVEIQDSETKKIYQQEIKLTDRSKEKSHDRNILCQTKQETKHFLVIGSTLSF
jgi:diphthamide biosynthesis methyltransferase